MYELNCYTINTGIYRKCEDVYEQIKICLTQSPNDVNERMENNSLKKIHNLDFKFEKMRKLFHNDIYVMFELISDNVPFKISCWKYR